jgi:hypothetical protein
MLAVIIAFIVIYSNTKKIIAKIKAMEKEAHESDIFSPWTIM